MDPCMEWHTDPIVLTQKWNLRAHLKYQYP